MSQEIHALALTRSYHDTLMLWCALCGGREATQRRYPKEYSRREKGTPLCDRCSEIWDEGRGR